MKKLYIRTTLLVGVLLLVNLVSNEFHLRLDLTREQQYTLSDATLNVLKGLEDPVTIKAYFSPNLPPNIVKTRQDFQEMLIEYSTRANGMVQYEFINPNEKEATEKEAVEAGIRPVMINIRDKDQVKQQKAFLGASLSMGDRKEVIPFVQPGAGMEYELTTAIKKLALTTKTSVGFIQGHGEPPLTELVQLDEQLRVLYTPEDIRITDSTVLPDKYKMLVWLAPTDSIPVSHFQQVDAFIARGGRIVVGINRVKADLQNGFGSGFNTGLEAWLAQKGIVVEDDFVVDASCGVIGLVEQQGPFSVQHQVQFPYLPVISRFADHPVSSGLESVLFEFLSSVKFMGDSSMRFTPLAFSSDKSNSLKGPQRFSFNQQWTDVDFPLRNLVVAAAVETKTSKMVVIGDGDFPVNGGGQRQQRRPADNINLLANAIDWLADDTGLISLRTKGATSHPIDQLDDSTRTILKYSNFLAPILLVVIYGIVRGQQNRFRRRRRMSDNYEKD